MDIHDLLRLVVDKGASDLHLRVPSPPVLRIDGSIVPQDDLPPVTAEDLQVALDHVTTEEQRDIFMRDKELDCAYSAPGLARFRLSVLQQRGTLSLAFRAVTFEVPSIEEMGLPEVCKELVLKPRGLILVTGPTGSGKSTTMAAMIRHLNENKGCKEITNEDQIENLHRNIKCMIAQPELRDDTRSFDIALMHALRHDPDVIMIGEMRDLDIISTALRAAETGHLVMGTLHTTDAAQTVDRVIDIFPSSQQPQIRLQLSQLIVAVLSQTLLPKADGKGRVAAFEIMIANTAVRNLIREGHTFQLTNMIEVGRSDGMQTLNQALAALVRQRLVSEEEARVKSSNPQELSRLLQSQYEAHRV